MLPLLPIRPVKSYFQGGLRKVPAKGKRCFPRKTAFWVAGVFLVVGTSVKSDAGTDLLGEEWLVIEGFERGRIRSDQEKRLEISSLRTKNSLLANCSKQYDLVGKTLRCRLLFSVTNSPWAEAGWQIGGAQSKDGKPFRVVVRPVSSQVKINNTVKGYEAKGAATPVELAVEFEGALAQISVNGKLIASEPIDYSAPAQTLNATVTQAVVEFLSVQLDD